MGTADNTGSSIEFANGAIEHANGLAIINFIAKQGPEYYYYDGDTYNWTTKKGTASTVRAASTNIVTYYPSSDFSGNIPYPKSATQYMAIVKPSQNTTFQSNAIRSWSLTYNVAKNAEKSQDVNIQRDGKNLGWVYSYTGKVQTFDTPDAGTYKLEVWGAQGGTNVYGTGGKGGYSVGEKIIMKGKILYVCIGGQGQANKSETSVSYSNGGYNGGGGLYTLGYGTTGGGASHISYSTGELRNLVSQKENVLLVAGGGGGSSYFPLSYYTTDGIAIKANTYYDGGYGGGEAGGSSQGSSSNKAGILQYTGGNQSSAGNGPIYNGAAGPNTVGGFGYGGSGHGGGACAGGGGSGWYGGMGGYDNSAGSGGSGYVNTTELTEASTIAGNISFTSPSGGTEIGHEGNGYAIITQFSN